MTYEEIIAPYLIDFDKLKVGDVLWSARDGEVKVTSMTKDFIEVSTDISFFGDGKYHNHDKYPTLFTSNPFAQFENHFVERVMEVSDNGVKWYPEKVFGIKNNYYLAWNEIESVLGWTVRYYKFAREIHPQRELKEKIAYHEAELIKLKGELK